MKPVKYITYEESGLDWHDAEVELPGRRCLFDNDLEGSIRDVFVETTSGDYMVGWIATDRKVWVDRLNQEIKVNRWKEI